jgi:pyroglutamyl-peptidase
MPFKDESNPTEEVVRYMKDRMYDGDRVVSDVLPVEFVRSANILGNMIDREKPHLVLSLGVSKAEKGTRRENLNLEKIGINLMNAKNPDASGYAPKNKLITPDGPHFYTTMFDVNGEEMVRVLAENDVRARTSVDANKYVCNCLIYKTAEKIKKEGGDTKFGFIHLPWLKGHDGIPEGKATMPLEEVIKGLELIIERA